MKDVISPDNVSGQEKNDNATTAAVINGATTLINNAAADYRAYKNRQWAEGEADKERQWQEMMWNATNTYNKPANQIARMEDAGLNPLYYGLDGQVASGVSGVSTPSVPNAPTIGIGNPYQAYKDAQLQDKQMELLNTQIDKLKSDIRNQDEGTEGIRLDNQWKERTMNARVEGQNLANSMQKEEIEKVNAQKSEITAHIQLLQAQTSNEYEKKLLIQAETWVKQATAQQIVELLPYQKNLMEAQTTAQKAQAAASYAKAAIDNKLLSSKYFDDMIDQMRANKESAEAIQAINNFKSSVMNGTLLPENTNSWFQNAGAHAFNSMFSFLSAVSNAIGGGLAGLISK